MSVNSKMTALANQVRELSGTTVPKGIDAMTTDVQSANGEITEQLGLIEQILNGLVGKSSSGAEIEYVIGTAEASGPSMPDMPLTGVVHYMNELGKYSTTNTKGSFLVMKDSIIFGLSDDGVRVSGDASQLGSILGTSKAFHVTGDFTIYV